MTHYRAIVSRTQFMILEFDDKEIEELDANEFAWTIALDQPDYDWETEHFDVEVEEFEDELP